jgi:hypothetical protein
MRYAPNRPGASLECNRKGAHACHHGSTLTIPLFEGLATLQGPRHVPQGTP